MSDDLDPDQESRTGFVGPDLDPKCLQMLYYQQTTKVATSKERVN